MHQEGQETNLPHTPQHLGAPMATPGPAAPRSRGLGVPDRPAVPGMLVLAWIYLSTHKKRGLNYTELEGNRVKAGGHTGLAAVVPSERFDVVFLQERAISAIIYLTGIKLARYSGPEFLLNRILSQHHLCQRCFLFQITCGTAALGVRSLVVWGF